MVTINPLQRSGLRERKKRETRDALADAAVRLALKHGLEGPLLRDALQQLSAGLPAPVGVGVPPAKKIA